MCFLFARQHTWQDIIVIEESKEAVSLVYAVYVDSNMAKRICASTYKQYGPWFRSGYVLKVSSPKTYQKFIRVYVGMPAKVVTTL